MVNRRKPVRARRGKAEAPWGQVIEVEIGSLGQRGDGLASHDGKTLFVAGAAPGDRLLVRLDGRRGEGWAATLIEVLVPGPARRPPPCRHFGRCGGCALQHLDDGAYAGWKRHLLVEALQRAGFDAARVAPLQQVGAGSRRRAALAFAHRRGVLTLGFNARASHEVVDIDGCLLLEPPLLDLLPSLQALLAKLTEEDGDAILTLTETGIDLLIEGEARLDLFERQSLAAFAESADLARLSWRRPGAALIEPVAERRRPLVRFGEVGVAVPPGAFLQPSRDGEQRLVELVAAAVGPLSPVADLFAGCGSFTFPLAQRAQVHAVEGDEAAFNALKASAGGRVTAERRDLAQRPLMGDELKRFQAVVFDPPRVGAAAQAEALAASGPARVVAVSCNPATLARDARTLVAGGYRLLVATPVDQFPWAAHLETVAVFER